MYLVLTQFTGIDYIHSLIKGPAVYLKMAEKLMALSTLDSKIYDTVFLIQRIHLSSTLLGFRQEP